MGIVLLTLQGGETALVIAATLGFPKVVKLLLEKGGDPNSFDTVNSRTSFIHICERI